MEDNNKELRNKIEELIKQKKSYREISNLLNISLGKIQRELKKKTNTLDSDTVTDTGENDTSIQSDTPKSIQQSDTVSIPQVRTFQPRELWTSDGDRNNPCNKCNRTELDKEVCNKYKEINRLGKHKLRICDYSEEELRRFTNAPYFD